MSEPTLKTPSGATRLDDWGVIRATGPDARTFLHSQLTQDMLHLEPGAARLAGFCSAKGRLQASFIVWRGDADDVLMACSADLLAATLKRLSMFVMRAQCKLTDASGDVALWGLAGDAAAIWLAAAAEGGPLHCAPAHGGTAVRLPDATTHGVAVRRWLWAAAAAAPPPLPLLPAESWRWLEVHSGVARIVAATAEQFVPQMVNLELVGGVNFQKGCYPGQEVVARSQYRGTLKRRSYVLASPVALHPGQEVFHSGDASQPAGRVVLEGADGGDHAALVELKIAATASGTLHAGARDGPPLALRPLPYPIPVDAG